MIKKAFACTDLRGELNVCPKRVCDDKIFSNRKPDFCHPVTILPTPYFNALRGVARARDYFASALKDAMEYLQTNHETGKLHGCAIEGGKWKQWKQSLTKLTKEENENGKISRC